MGTLNTTVAEQIKDDAKEPPEGHPSRSRGNLTTDKNSNTKLSQADAERHRAIVDAPADGIIVADRFGNVRSINRAAEAIFGYSVDEVIDRNVNYLMPEAYQTEHDGCRSDRGTGERQIVGIGREVVGLRKDGTTVALELSISEWVDVDGQQCFTGIMRDIAQRDLQARELLIEREVAERARLKAEGASRLKTEFLAAMSHEIRTPLTSISGFLELLTHSGDMTQQQSRYIDLIRSANTTLLTIVNNILDFSKIETGQLELECNPFSTQALVSDVIAIVLPIASAKNLRIEYAADESMPEWLMGDQPRLRQVLLNLLSDAVKFTERGLITINTRAQMLADGREMTKFSVTATGTAIHADQKHRLFKTFSQAATSIGQRDGATDVGLAVCKRLVELMDGQFGVFNNADRGCTVWFTAYLPLTTKPAPELTSASTLQHSGEGGSKILVVDDIDTNREIVEAYLTDNGYRVDTVASATAAIEMLQSGIYDLVLMDIQMPVMDGVAATRVIRALPSKIRDIPIIAMTGNVLPQQVKSFLDAGMNDHVGKPIERTKLYNNVRRWLPKVQVDDEINSSLDSPHFDKTKYNEFVRALGVGRVERTAQKFLDQLDKAFESTRESAMHEAHDLINCAGVLGFPGLVDACRAICAMRSDEPNTHIALFDEARKARAVVRQVLVGHIIPNLQGMTLGRTG